MSRLIMDPVEYMTTPFECLACMFIYICPPIPLFKWFYRQFFYSQRQGRLVLSTSNITPHNKSRRADVEGAPDKLWPTPRFGRKTIYPFISHPMRQETETRSRSERDRRELAPSHRGSWGDGDGSGGVWLVVTSGRLDQGQTKCSWLIDSLDSFHELS